MEDWKFKMRSKIYNIFYERKIPDWKATSDIPDILVITSNPPNICPYEFWQTWDTSPSGYTWDTYPITSSWGDYAGLICPTLPTDLPYWCANTFDRDGGIIDEIVIPGTIFDDQS